MVAKSFKMSHIDPGPLASYNSLSDPNLTAYFNNSRMRKHLIKTGLITRRGEIVSEKVFRLNNARKEHQRHVRDLLAQAIVHKALDMERHRQMQIKKQLEEIGKVERVRRVRADRALRGDEDILPLLSAPAHKPQAKERPHTAPAGRTVDKPSTSHNTRQQLPQSVGYPAIPGDSPYNTRSSRIKTPYPNVEIDNQYLSQLDQEALRTFTLNLSNYDLGSGVSPYMVPVLDPASREAIEKIKPTKKRRRKFKKRPATAPATTKREKGQSLSARSNKHSLELHRREPPMIYKKQPRSLCLITFKYLGQIVNLDREMEDPRDEIVVDQQHCGGGNLCVYKGKLLPGNNFTIISQRHRGFPFSLTFYLNGIIVERLSACCEYKHRTGYKLGAKTSHFGFVKIEGVHPCYKCLVASQKFRTTSDQSALAENTFKTRDLQPKPPSPKEEPKVKTSETSYEDSFGSSESESSSDSSSISSLTPAEEEKSVTSESASSHSDKQSSGGKSSTPKSSKHSSSTSALSDSTVEENPKASFVQKLDSGRRSKTNKSPSGTSSISTFTSDSEMEEKRVNHPEPMKLKQSIRSLCKQKDRVDLSHFSLTNDQVDELRQLLMKDSLNITSLVLYNTNLTSDQLRSILETVVSCCSNIKHVDIGRIKDMPVDAVVQLAEKTKVETLVLNDASISSSDMEELMTGMKRVYSPSNTKPLMSSKQFSKTISLSSSRPASSQSYTSTSSFNQMTLLQPDGNSNPSQEAEPCLQTLSLNGVGIDKKGIISVADFLAINPPLSDLYLNENGLVGDALKPLWSVLSSGKNTHLKTLTLALNKLGDQGVEEFAKMMMSASNLEKVQLTKNGITEASGRHLIDFVKNNKSIKNLIVSQGNNIKRKTLKEIKKTINSKK